MIVYINEPKTQATLIEFQAYVEQVFKKLAQLNIELNKIPKKIRTKPILTIAESHVYKQFIDAYEAQARIALNTYHIATIRIVEQAQLIKFESEMRKYYNKTAKTLREQGYLIPKLQTGIKEIAKEQQGNLIAATQAALNMLEAQEKQKEEIFKSALKQIKNIKTAWKPRTVIFEIGDWAKRREDGQKWASNQRKAWKQSTTQAKKDIIDYIRQAHKEGKTFEEVFKRVKKDLNTFFPDNTVPIRQIRNGKLITMHQDIGTYTSGWVRTIQTLAYNETQVGNLLAQGDRFIKIVGIEESCPICSNYIGKVYDLKGKNKLGIPPASNLPPYHPNCDCMIVPYSNL